MANIPPLPQYYLLEETKENINIKLSSLLSELRKSPGTHLDSQSG